MDGGVPASAGNFSSHLAAIDEQYLLDANARAGAGLSAVKIKNMFVKVNDDVIANIAARLFDGYTLRVTLLACRHQRCPTICARQSSQALPRGAIPVKIAKGP